MTSSIKVLKYEFCYSKYQKLEYTDLCNRWVQRLPQYFIDAQLEKIKYEFNRFHAWQRRMESNSLVAVFDDIISTVYSQDQEKLTHLQVCIKGAIDEVSGGAYITQPLIVVVGQKPIPVS